MNSILLFLLVVLGMTDSGISYDLLHATQREEAVYELPSSPMTDAWARDFPNQVFMLDRVYQQFSVKPTSMSISKQGNPRETVHLELRKLGKPREELNFQEITSIREAIYKAIGKRFSLEITTKVIPKEAEVVGVITATDAKERRVLIANSESCLKEACRQKPEAYWLRFEADTVIKSANGLLKFDDMRVGDWLNVWTTGAVELSYPAQTVALEVEIAAPLDETPIALTTIMKSDFKGIDKINIRLGDGKKLEITDSQWLADISSRLQAIELVPSRDYRTFYGFLYTMEISIGKNKYRYDSSFAFDGHMYRQNEWTQEFNAYMISTARTHIPNLLPGIE
ncbi:hypothetical protein [Paenibacillus sp. N3.4]|uniref:hypothetical protein n=1 Tax=Paenibacillus sp. N3.4 TaxID=2603222 RepID=UPI0011CA6915|nr:hypothetical protein [Paenibacillus sp. N3.4]TXK75388.1 hypothetical protein FU659_27625 [Paenibacillus sp. N3.4]